MGHVVDRSRGAKVVFGELGDWEEILTIGKKMWLSFGNTGSKRRIRK